jgi:hypothetical protein
MRLAEKLDWKGLICINSKQTDRYKIRIHPNQIRFSFTDQYSSLYNSSTDTAETNASSALYNTEYLPAISVNLLAPD